ncbi:MAG: VWA domain-containing protein, partial [Deltaproteobacteria bacterium]|nr:VWA domain-containing protein [Deltaproteobacteria bacterium]
MTLENPIYLLLLLLVPGIWLMMNRSSGEGGLSRRQLILAGLRSVLVILVAVALANPRLPNYSDQVNVFFCLDVSESVSEDQQLMAKTFMKKAGAEMKSEDQAGLIVFGKQPSLETSLVNDFKSAIIRSHVNPNYTNIYEALQIAIGKFPQQGHNKIVVFTDGNENIARSEDMANLAGSLGVEIYPVPMTTWFDKNEAFIQSLETPAHIALESPFEIRLVVISSKDSRGEVLLVRNESLLTRQSTELHKGLNVITFADKLVEPGLYMYQAVLNSADDTFFQNNEGLSFTRGTQKSRVLYLTAEGRQTKHLSEMLTTQGLVVDRKRIRDISGSIHDFSAYNAIILDNLSGRSISFSAMEQLDKYVKDMGGGLLMIGGDQSFGAGYYKKTPVEKALPVYMDVPTDIQLSELYLVYIIDKSSSMLTTYGNKTKLEIAKIAAFSSIEMLNPTDSIGIVTFDTEFEWTVPMIRAIERQQIADKLSRVMEGGGTDLYPALKQVSEVLGGITSARKHVIILSDGETEEADFETLARAMSASDISISTVSIGKGSHVALMQSIAEWGNGRSYYTDDPNDIPRIFTGETKIISRKMIAEKTMRPVLRMPHEIVQGIKDQLPVIYGQIITYPKPGASVLMNTSQGPLLAAWQYGLGRSVAYTSDLSARWGKEWVAWEHYGRFVSQMVKWARRKATNQQFAATIHRNGEKGTFTVDITTNENRFVNHLNLSAN